MVIENVYEPNKHAAERSYTVFHVFSFIYLRISSSFLNIVERVIFRYASKFPKFVDIRCSLVYFLQESLEIRLLFKLLVLMSSLHNLLRNRIYLYSGIISAN